MTARYIFVIGFNKTATGTIHHFFSANNIPGVHWDKGNLAKRMIDNMINGRKIFVGYEHFEVFSDMMFLNERIFIEGNTYFKNMDRDYPDSLFIYNTRNIVDWINSRLNHVGLSGRSFVERCGQCLHTTDIDQIIYSWVACRERLEKELSSYFKGSNRLLSVDIADASAPHAIADFVGRPLDVAHWEWKHRTALPKATPLAGELRRADSS